jgi:hypothetical protein
LIGTKISFIKEIILGFSGTAFPVPEYSPVILEYELFGVLNDWLIFKIGRQYVQ